MCTSYSRYGSQQLNALTYSRYFLYDASKIYDADDTMQQKFVLASAVHILKYMYNMLVNILCAQFLFVGSIKFTTVGRRAHRWCILC